MKINLRDVRCDRRCTKDIDRTLHFSRICHSAIVVLQASSDRLSALGPLGAKGVMVVAIALKGQVLVVGA